MNQLKKLLGIVWIALGPLAIYYLVQTAVGEMSRKPDLDTKIQWIVFVVVFLPIAVGMIIFGYYCWKGEYDHLPESSAEIED